MRIIGIDPSLTGTCAYDGEEFLYLKDLGSAKKPMERLGLIRAELAAFIGPDVDEVWLEDYAFSRAQHAHAKGELGFMIRDMLYPQVPTVLAKPNTRAKFATGKGNANKSMVVSQASARTGMMFDSDDHCDAFLLWCMAMEANGFEHPMGKLPKTHLEALKKVSILQ